MTSLETIKEKELKWLGVDLDKCVAHNSEYPEFKLLEPLDGAREALDGLVAKGWKIIIYTARAWHEYDQIEMWLNKHQIPFRRIVCGKLFVKWMIDDRAIGFRGNWEDVLKEIK